MEKIITTKSQLYTVSLDTQLSFGYDGFNTVTGVHSGKEIRRTEPQP